MADGSACEVSRILSRSIRALLGVNRPPLWLVSTVARAPTSAEAVQLATVRTERSSSAAFEPNAPTGAGSTAIFPSTGPPSSPMSLTSSAKDQPPPSTTEEDVLTHLD